MNVYPLVILLHLSNPVAHAKQEITTDYLGMGLGVELKNGLTVEGTIGAASIGCTGPKCGNQQAGSIQFTWRGRRK